MLKGSSAVAGVFLIVSSLGCQELAERVTPDRVSAGLAARQLRGRHNGFKADAVIPLWEVRAKKRLTDNLDLYGRLQLNRGAVEADHPIARGEGEGHLESVGLGLNYYPFETRAIGLDWGAEGYHAAYQMRGGFGPIGDQTSDRFAGLGTNLGLVGEVPLDKKKRWSLVWGAGYNLTATDAHRADVSLDGWYGTLGFQLNLSR